MELAEATNNEEIPDGMNLPEEIARCEDRIKAITEAKTKIEGRAKERFEQEQVEYQDKMNKREAKAKEIGNKPRGNNLSRQWTAGRTKTRSTSPMRNHVA